MRLRRCDHFCRSTVDKLAVCLKYQLFEGVCACLFEKHYSAFAEVFKSQQLVSITEDEATDVRDHSILNVMASRGKPYLIGADHMWKHATIVHSVRQ